ncbi:MAG: hypothetical protein OEZ43_15620 [Gammaproteobacteria bacterium]|nr:hypothetical protein [Gammaproteobacteria bacterium]
MTNHSLASDGDTCRFVWVGRIIILSFVCILAMSFPVLAQEEASIIDQTRKMPGVQPEQKPEQGDANNVVAGKKVIKSKAVTIEKEVRLFSLGEAISQVFNTAPDLKPDDIPSRYNESLVLDVLGEFQVSMRIRGGGAIGVFEILGLLLLLLLARGDRRGDRRTLRR